MSASNPPAASTSTTPVTADGAPIFRPPLVPCAVAASTLFALPHPAEAAVVYVNIPDIVLAPPENVQHNTVIDLNGGAANGAFRFNAGFSSQSGVVSMVPLPAGTLNAGIGQYLTVGARMGRLAADAVIGPAAGSWRNSTGFMINGGPGGGVFGNWNVGQTGFAGLRISLGNGNCNYGWIRMRTQDTQPVFGIPDGLTIFDYAYETTPNLPILAGATISVPEPTSSALLALAALGGSAIRRRRK